MLIILYWHEFITSRFYLNFEYLVDSKYIRFELPVKTNEFPIPPKQPPQPELAPENNILIPVNWMKYHEPMFSAIHSRIIILLCFFMNLVRRLPILHNIFTCVGNYFVIVYIMNFTPKH